MMTQHPISIDDYPSSILNVRSLILQLLLIFTAGLFIYGYRLGDSPLDRTEPFRALVAHQMVQSHDWLIPRLYGEVYLRKPPLMYWIQASTEKLFGHGDEFVWRLPSVVGSAFLAAFLAWWSARWFGPRALLPSGFACLALIALWDQNRGADIDALNTVGAMLTTVCILELVCGLGFKPILWTIGLSLSLGATLLLKGPGGLPQMLGAVVGPAIFLRSWKPGRKPLVWIGIVIGFAIFAAYITEAAMVIKRMNIPSDATGWREAMDKGLLQGWAGRLKALVLPVELLAFALPVSTTLPFALIAIRRTPADHIHRQRAIAILGTLAATALVWALDGNYNPRYEYVMFPLLAPLAGFVWTTWTPAHIALRRAMSAICLMLAGGYLLVVIKSWREIPEHNLVLVVGSIGIVGTAFAIFRNRKMYPMATVALLLLFAIPMGERKNAERRRKSSKTPAAQLRSIIGQASRVSAAGLVRDLPELFYYANVDVDSFGESGLAKLAAQCGGHWVVLSQTTEFPNYSAFLRDNPAAFPGGTTKLHMPDPRDQIYVGWYDPPKPHPRKFQSKPGSGNLHRGWGELKLFLCFLFHASWLFPIRDPDASPRLLNWQMYDRLIPRTLPVE